MQLELTEQQRRQLREGVGDPVRFTDPDTGREYVILRADVFDRMHALLDDSLDMRQVGALVEENMREEDEGDPLLEWYQQYRRPS